MPHFLSVHNLAITLGDINILKNVSFDIEKGEVVSIIGPNGAGKTTLIRAMLGLIPFEGRILYKGSPIAKHINSIGYVPQRFEFDKTFPLSVSEFLDLFSNKATSKNTNEQICEELRVNSLLNKKIGDLSGGQLQRILIAQALIKNPELLILDEPTSGVDAEGISSFYEIVGHLNQEHHVTIILISHELSMVYRLATTVVCLNRNLVCFGAPKTVLTDDVLASMYGKNLEHRGHTH